MEKDTGDLQVMSGKRGEKDCKPQRPGRTGAKQWLPDVAESLHCALMAAVVAHPKPT